MADKILKAVREDLDDGNCHCYHLTYEVEDAGTKNLFVVVIKASEMSDPEDAQEAKTLANDKAAVIKTDWITAKATANTNTNKATLEGPVTL